MSLATTTLRLGLGGLMAGHGLQKLAGKFGGAGLDGTTEAFESMGFSPPRPYATAAALAETVGGGLIAAGMLTPVGAAMVTGVMTVAIAKVHGKNGLWVTDGGMEYNLMIVGAAFAVAEAGPGLLAVDGILTKRRKGLGWALFELVAGVAGGAGVVALSQRTPGPTDTAAGSSWSAPGSSSDSSSPADSAEDDTLISGRSGGDS